MKILPVYHLFYSMCNEYKEYKNGNKGSFVNNEIPKIKKIMTYYNSILPAIYGYINTK